ncbi:MAG: response regulator transcription factor [Chloroflexi bacterium]|nr:response regulator transcription factor [Chloroflexota bacterium]
MRDKTILVIDDDEQIRQLVQSLMEQEGARVITASGGESALRQFYRYQPDLVIVDMMMPLMSGWEVCRRIRELSDVPLMMLTAVQGDQETVRALTLGCDDYVTKPFCPSVLVARANVLLRRAHLEHGRQPDCNYRDGYLTVDLDAQCVRVEGEPVRLTPTEFALLSLLVRRAGKLCTFEQIIDQLWPEGVGGSEAAVHTYIWQLRQKLERDPHNPQYLIGLRGRGYRFDPLSAEKLSSFS